MTNLAALAIKTLRANDLGAFIKPAAHQYPHQWNWDAAFVALGLSTFDLPRARLEVRTLLSGQWRDGMVPHILYPNGASDYFPTPDFWRSEGLPHGPAFATSGLTQPPVLASAVRALHARAHDADASFAFLREVYPKLLAWHRWLRTARDPDGTGLVAIIHPWESGTDNATRWTHPLARLIPHDVPAYARKDYRHVREDERPDAHDYERFIYLIGLFRAWRWDAAHLYRDSPFLVQDVLFNAILHRADEDLRQLAVLLGEPTEELDAWRTRTHAAFAKLWHQEDGLYYDRDLRSGYFIRESTCAAFAPLYAGIPDAVQAERLLAHLRDPRHYAPGDDSRYYLPSASKASPLYEPRRYWRGPVWIHINWLVAKGLRRYGQTEFAALLEQHSLALVSRAGFVEYYDPRDGAPLGARNFSWSAALTLDLLSNLDGKQEPHGQP
ncbi:MAG: glycoside hydrolase [Truepera sp.]|nr:glycoside hydrolase [Truepera sp.]